MRYRSLLLAVAMCLLSALCSYAQTPPAILSADEVTSREGAQVVNGAFPGLLLESHDDRKEFDSKYNQPYHAVCYGYCGERQAGRSTGAVDRYLRRFAVHVSERQALPLAHRVAQMLVLLYGEAHARLQYDHAYHEMVEVWLTDQAPSNLGDDAGGEQYKNQIYIYKITAERRPIEWAREVAHEYGHYSLPGVTGFTAPEPWANGVLGERLYLKWLSDDLRTGVLHPAEIPLVDSEQLNEYIAKQVTPLIGLVASARDTFDAAPLTRKDATAMDHYTALALYLDAVYGSAMLFSAMQYTEPRAGSTFVMAPDFLRGALAALRGATELDITPPSLSEGKPAGMFLIYLPAGDWTVTKQGPVQSWQLRPDNKGVHFEGKDRVFVTTADWRRLVLSLGQSSAQPPHLIWHKKEAELH